MIARENFGLDRYQKAKSGFYILSFIPTSALNNKLHFMKLHVDIFSAGSSSSILSGAALSGLENTCRQSNAPRIWLIRK